MMRRQADDEGAAVANLGSAAEGAAVNSIARKAATAKSRTRALARRLRKSSRMASLTADVSEGIEQIAGFSDGIIESFEDARRFMDRIAREAREGAELRRSLTGISSGTREVSGETTTTLGELSTAFSRHEEILRGILSLIQEAAGTQNDIQKQVQELSLRNEAVEDISGRLDRLLERADISSLNAALESERGGESGAGFGRVSVMVRKSVEAFERKAEEASRLLERMKTAHGTLSAKTAVTAERIQAIGVMTKGVRNAFTDAEGVIADLLAEADEIADRIHTTFDGLDGEPLATDAVLEVVERAAGSIELSATRLEDQENRFAETADRAEQLLASTGRLASAENLSGALDTIYTDTETFTRSIETTLERLALSVAAIHAAAHEMELLSAGSGNATGLDSLSGTAEGAREAALRLRDRTAALRENLGAALAVLGDVARELAFLGEASEAVNGEVVALRPLYRGISRLAGQAGAFAGQLDLLAVMGGIETARAGEPGAVFAALPGEFEAAATEAAEVEQAVCDLSDRLDDHLDDMTNGQGKLDWRGLGESFDCLIDGVRDLLETRLSAAEEKGAELADSLTGFSERIEAVREKNAEVGKAVRDAIRVIEEAGNSCEKQRDAFRRAIATAEKICSLADELYPEE